MLKFSNHHKQMQQAFVIYADFEAITWSDPTILHFVLLYVEDGSGHPSFVSPQHSACLS